MRYVRTKDEVTTSNKVTHELTKDICDAGYLRVLKKGAAVRIGLEWYNFYGHWVDLIDKDGCHYSIRPDSVEKVTKELPQADDIKYLCDAFIHGRMTFKTLEECLDYAPAGGKVYGAIWVEGENGEPILKSVAQLNDEGGLDLI